MNTALQILLTIVGSSALFGFVQFLITRKDNRDDKLKALEEKLKKRLEEREFTGKNRYLEHKEAILNLSAGIDKIVASVETNQNTIEVMASGMVGMMHNTILYTSQPILDRGAVTYEELETLNSLYKPYAALGGNGACKRRMEDVNKLPTISEKEAENRDRALQEAKKRSQEDR